MKTLTKEVHELKDGIHFYSSMLMLHIFFTFEFLDTVPFPIRDHDGSLIEYYLGLEEISLYLDTIDDQQIAKEINEYGFDEESRNPEDDRRRFIYHAILDTKEEYKELNQMTELFDTVINERIDKCAFTGKSPSDLLKMRLKIAGLCDDSNGFKYTLQNDMPAARELFERVEIEEEKREIEAENEELQETIEELKNDHKIELKEAKEKAAEESLEFNHSMAYNDGWNEAIDECISALYRYSEALEHDDLLKIEKDFEELKQDA